MRVFVLKGYQWGYEGIRSEGVFRYEGTRPSGTRMPIVGCRITCCLECSYVFFYIFLKKNLSLSFSFSFTHTMYGVTRRYVPGAGSTEIELASQLARFAGTCPGLEQYSIAAFAEVNAKKPSKSCQRAL